MKHDFLADLDARGLVHQVSQPSHDGWLTLAQRFSQGSITAYIGFDPTAESLHVGSLLPVMNLVRLQRAGHRPIAVIGGGTGLIGDPSGKVSERAMLTRDQLAVNLQGLRGQLERFLDFSGGLGARLIDNAEWLCELRLLDFLRDIGKLFSVNQMVARDSVRQRLDGREQGISYTEFSYALLQGYDFLVLHDRFDCELQMGGSDQWGNITDGIDLIRRLRGKPSFGLTSPLVTKADGTKFGKSEKGNVWLAANLTRPFSFHQFWLNQADADAVRYLNYFTFLPVDEIAALDADGKREPHARHAQRRLADEVTRFVHGDPALRSVLRAAAVLFDGGDLRQLTCAELVEALADAPRTQLAASRLGTPGASLVTALVEAGLETSKGRARSAIESGAVSINGLLERDPKRILAGTDRLPAGFIVVRRGKKSHHVLETL
jgi:tyrosyl-tRNA synthetase